MLRNVIVVTDSEEGIENAKREMLRARRKGYEVALDYTNIKDKDRKREIIKMFIRDSLWLTE
jgi:hypothetical protein